MFRFKPLFYRGLVVCCVLTIILLSGVVYQRQFKANAQTLPNLEPTESVERIEIADDYYGYSFEVLDTWYGEMGPTPDRWAFLSDPSVAHDESSQSLHGEVPPGGLIAVEFAVDPVPSWLPEPEVSNPLVDERGNATSASLIPLLPSGTWIQVADVPTLVVEQNEQELAESDGGHFTRGTSVYILTERMVYFLSFGYAPPTNGDEAEAERDYEQAITDILNSFVIDLEAPAAWQPVSVPIGE